MLPKVQRPKTSQKDKTRNFITHKTLKISVKIDVPVIVNEFPEFSTSKHDANSGILYDISPYAKKAPQGPHFGRSPKTTVRTKQYSSNFPVSKSCVRGITRSRYRRESLQGASKSPKQSFFTFDFDLWPKTRVPMVYTSQSKNSKYW